MNEELNVVLAKRNNILLIFASATIFVFLTFFLFNHLFEKVAAKVDEIRSDYNPLLVSSEKGMEILSNSGAKTMENLSKEMPKVTEAVSQSVGEVTKDYASTKTKVSEEYAGIKDAVRIEYDSLKAELADLKRDIRKDLEWLKSEIESWRRLIVFAVAVFGVVTVLISVQDILENVRWLLSFFKRSGQEPAS